MSKARTKEKGKSKVKTQIHREGTTKPKGRPPTNTFTASFNTYKDKTYIKVTFHRFSLSLWEDVARLARKYSLGPGFVVEMACAFYITRKQI
jgi:hypothetical protein